MSNIKMSEKSTIRLMINLLCNKIFIFAPLYFKQSSGLVALIITSSVFVTSLILWNLYCKFCTDSIISIIKTKIIKHIFAALTTLICSLIIIATIKQYSIALKTTVLKETPINTIAITITLITLIGYSTSLKSIGTAATLFVPIIYFVAIFLILFSVSKSDLYNMFPVLDTTNNKIFADLILMLSMNYELIFLFFIPDILINPKSTRTTGNKIIIWSYVCFLIISIIFSIILPETEYTNQEPFFRIIRMAHVGSISLRLDSLFLILYCISAYIYLSSILSLTIKMINMSFSKKVSIYVKYTILITLIFIPLNTQLCKYIFDLFSQYYAMLFITTFIPPLILIVRNQVQKCKLKN